MVVLYLSCFLSLCLKERRQSYFVLKAYCGVVLERDLPFEICWGSLCTTTNCFILPSSYKKLQPENYLGIWQCNVRNGRPELENAWCLCSNEVFLFNTFYLLIVFSFTYPCI